MVNLQKSKYFYHLDGEEGAFYRDQAEDTSLIGITFWQND
jgi:hypothetical protein